MSNQIIEYLTQATHDQNFVVSDLKNANKEASSVEHIIIIDLIERSRQLEQDISQLLNAITGQ